MFEKLGIVNRKVVVYLVLTFLIVGICIGLIMAQNNTSEPADKNGAVFVENRVGGTYEFKC